MERTVNRRSTSRPKGSAAIKLTNFLPECEIWPATGTRPGLPVASGRLNDPQIPLTRRKQRAWHVANVWGKMKRSKEAVAAPVLLLAVLQNSILAVLQNSIVELAGCRTPQRRWRKCGAGGATDMCRYRVVLRPPAGENYATSAEIGLC